MALAVTATLDLKADNGIFSSEDAGLTWQTTEILLPDRLFLSVGHGKDSAWATAVWYETRQAWVYRHTPSDAWVEHEVLLDDKVDQDIHLRLLAASQTDSETAWFVVGPYGDNQVLRTTDGGESYQEVFATEGDIIDATTDDDNGLWILVSGVELWYAQDGETFQYMSDAPTGLGINWARERLYIAARNQLETAPLQASPDGVTFQPLMSFSEITGVRQCPKDSHVAEICTDLWYMVEERITASNKINEDTTDTGTPPTTDEPECGCATGKVPGIIGIVLGCIGLIRRRR